jgi:hypothetical protein
MARGRIVGSAAAFAAGFAAFWLMSVSPPLYALVVAAASIAAALILRAVAALLLVPVALWLGTQAAVILFGALHGYLSGPAYWGGAAEFAAILLMLAAAPAFVGAAIGVWTGARTRPGLRGGQAAER